MKVNAKEMKWIREPKQYEVTEDKVEIITQTSQVKIPCTP